MVAGLRRQEADLVGGDVRHVGGQDVYAAAQGLGQGGEQVALVDVAAEGRDIAAGAAHGGRVDVGGVQFGPAEGRGQRGADRAGTAAQVHDDGRRGARGHSQLDEELGTAAGDEDTGLHAMRRPWNPAQPRTCSRGSPATRRSTMAAISSGVRAVERINSASSSAKTQPAERSAATRNRGRKRGHGSREPFGEPKGALAVTYRR